MWTADQVCITDELRVWTLPDAEPGLRVWTRPQVEPGTVDLASALTPSGPDPAVRVDFESGWSVIVTATTLTTRHPRTGPWPPALGVVSGGHLHRARGTDGVPSADVAVTGMPHLPMTR